MNGAQVVKSLGSELDVLLRDIPIDHIVKGVQVFSRALFVRYFKGYRLQVAGKKRVRSLVDNEIREKGNEELAQLFMTLWNRANGRLYHAIYNKVREVNEEVDKIERIDDEVAGRFLGELLEEFDADRLYLCILFNEVKVSREIVKEKLDKEIPFAEWPPAPEPEEEEAEEPAAEAAANPAASDS
jgi:hypothetical protein